jgi:hypothetical protein
MLWNDWGVRHRATLSSSITSRICNRCDRV